MGFVLKTVLKEVRAASSALNSSEIRASAARTPRVGLAAVSEEGYRDMERFLCAGISDERALNRAAHAIRRATPDQAGDFDLILCEATPILAPLPGNAYRLDERDPARTAAAVVAGLPDLELALGCTFPVFRHPAADNIIRRISSENALFAAASALPNVIPGLLELPWAVGEFASDTAFLTMNQIRMAIQLAALHGNPAGYSDQKLQIATIAGGAFGWRAIARELVGKIPLGGGIIPKAAIAYAGTWVVGEGLKRINRGEPRMSLQERRQAYAAALEKGKAAAKDLLPSLRRARTRPETATGRATPPSDEIGTGVQNRS